MLVRKTVYDFGRMSTVGFDRRRANPRLFQLSTQLHRRMATIGAALFQLLRQDLNLCVLELDDLLLMQLDEATQRCKHNVPGVEPK